MRFLNGLGFLLVAVSGVLSSTAVADVEIEKEPTLLVYKNPSQVNRQEKNYVLAAQLLGAGSAGVLQMGVIAGVHLDSNNIIQFEASGGSLKNSAFITNPSIGDGVRTVDGYSAGVHFKHFTGNSFYFKTGVDYRHVKYRYEGNWPFSSNDDYNFEGDGFVGTFVIGNQWQWSNFTLGCDWVGITVPLSHNIQNKSIESGSSTYAQNDMNDRQDQYLNKIQIQGLRLYLGATF